MRPDARRWTGLGLARRAQLRRSPWPDRWSCVASSTSPARAARPTELTSLALVFLGLAVATQLILVIVSPGAATVTAWHTTNQIRLQLAEHVLGLDHEFHRRHTPGELIQRVDGDVTSVSDFLGRVVPRVVGAAAMVLGMLVVLVVVDWRLALGVVGLRRRRGGHHRARPPPRRGRERPTRWASYAQLYGGIEERLTAAEDLRANGAGAHAMWRFVEESADAMNSSVRRESAFLRLWWAVQGSVAVGSAVSLVAGAVLVSNGAITLGTAFLMFQYVLLLERPLEDVVQQLETVQKANGAMVRVIDLLAVQPTIVDSGTTSPAAGPLAVEFDAVSFEYADEHDDDSDTTDIHAERCCTTSRSRSAPGGRWASSAAPAAARPRSRACCCGWSSRPTASCGSAAFPSPTSR